MELKCLRILSWSVSEHEAEVFDNMERKIFGKTELKCLRTWSRNIWEVSCQEKVPHTEQN
jgi:hypothetical protein